MTAITFSDFSGGLDRRLPVTVQDASRLWVLRNAYITNGKRIAKRRGLKKITDALSGSVGLCAVNGRLKVFYSAGGVFTAPLQVDAIRLSVPSDLPAGKKLERIYSAQVFNGYTYVVAEYDLSGVYLGGISEGNTGGAGGGSTPPSHIHDPQPGDPGTA